MWVDFKVICVSILLVILQETVQELEVTCNVNVKESDKVTPYSGLLKIERISKALYSDVYRITNDFQTPPYINLMEKRVEQFTLENEFYQKFSALSVSVTLFKMPELSFFSRFLTVLNLNNNERTSSSSIQGKDIFKVTFQYTLHYDKDRPYKSINDVDRYYGGVVFLQIGKPFEITAGVKASLDEAGQTNLILKSENNFIIFPYLFMNVKLLLEDGPVQEMLFYVINHPFSLTLLEMNKPCVKACRKTKWKFHRSYSKYVYCCHSLDTTSKILTMPPQSEKYPSVLINMKKLTPQLTWKEDSTPSYQYCALSYTENSLREVTKEELSYPFPCPASARVYETEEAASSSLFKAVGLRIRVSATAKVKEQTKITEDSKTAKDDEYFVAKPLKTLPGEMFIKLYEFAYLIPLQTYSTRIVKYMFNKETMDKNEERSPDDLYEYYFSNPYPYDCKNQFINLEQALDENNIDRIFAAYIKDDDVLFKILNRIKDNNYIRRVSLVSMHDIAFKNFEGVIGMCEFTLMWSSLYENYWFYVEEYIREIAKEVEYVKIYAGYINPVRFRPDKIIFGNTDSNADTKTAKVYLLNLALNWSSNEEIKVLMYSEIWKLVVTPKGSVAFSIYNNIFHMEDPFEIDSALLSTNCDAFGIILPFTDVLCGEASELETKIKDINKYLNLSEEERKPYKHQNANTKKKFAHLAKPNSSFYDPLLIQRHNR